MKDKPVEIRPRSVSRRSALAIASAGGAVTAGIVGLGRQFPYFCGAPPRWPASRSARFAEVWGAAAARNPIGTLIDDNHYGPTAPGRITAAGMEPTPGYRIISAARSPGMFRLFGGRLRRRYDDWQALSVTYPDGHPAQNTARVAFMTDARRFDVAVGASATAGYRVLVDGLYLSRLAVSTATAQGARQYLTVTVGDPHGESTLRRIDVETFSPEGAFSGVAIPTEAAIEQVADTAYRIACFSDSLGAGTGCKNQNDAWDIVAGYLLGGVELDMIQVALGGTGFVRDGPAWRAIRHLKDLVAQPVDEVWVELGINDADYPMRRVTRAAALFLRAIRKLLPQAPIVLIGIAREDNDRAMLLEHALYDALHFWGDKNTLWSPLQTPGKKLFTGNIGGTGNFVAGEYGGGIDGQDNTHPNVRGHLHFARYVADRRSRAAL